MKRKIINIDEELCNGCGLCIPNCHEGALQLIDGKARLISDLFCDGLGACLGHCPEGAITIEEREAEPYDERKVMEMMLPKGRNTILAHLQHLKEHNETGFLNEAIAFIREYNVDLSPINEELPKHNTMHEHSHSGSACGCQGSAAIDFREEVAVTAASDITNTNNIPSELRQWPVQLHLLNPRASYLQNADLVLASDCSAFSVGNFHQRFLKGKALAIACPKLDTGKEIYIEKLSSMISDSKINTMTVIIMEVPCCGGLSQLAQIAVEKSGRKIPVKQIVVGIKGDVLAEDWI
jgi:ferredoxin